MNTKIKIIILIVILLIAFIVIINNIIIQKEENKIDSNVNVSQEIAEPKFQDNTETVKEILIETEEDYQETIEISSIYNRNDFYNETRMNINSENGYISLNIDDLNIEEIYKVYNAEGEEIEELPMLTYFEQEIEVSNSDEFTVGNYYLIKYQPYDENYSYYYVSQLTNNGFKQLDLYLITQGETIGNENVIE